MKEPQTSNPFAQMEEDVLKFWEDSKTFEQSVNKEAPQGDYVFYDGPPFITGLPHYATLLPSIAKDVIPRYWTMKGYRVKRVWGWDCHGLPAENKVEKELNLKNKKDIEELGVDKFVDACRNYVQTGSEQWQWYINRIARWVDMEHAYKTMDISFMESVIWAFKMLYDKGLIYEGYRSSLHCPRCATPLSKFEITMDAGSYRDVTDESVVVKFELTNPEKLDASLANDKVYVLAWTTTPWTLPGNLALAINSEINYCVVKVFNREQRSTDGIYEYIKVIVAEDIFNKIVESGNSPKVDISAIERSFGFGAANKIKEGEAPIKFYSEVIKIVKGADLIGLSYIPLFELNNDSVVNNKNSHKIYHADYVSTEDGTGVVHIAPNFGDEDFELGKKVGLPTLELMDEMGHYQNAGEFSGMYYKKAGQKVMEELGDRLFAKFLYTHSYPFCYRCDTPLIYKTQKAWYMKIDEIRQRMIETNKNINWVPEYFKEGRFQYNLENAPDWCLSRSRYWGSPIPVWRCEDCGELKVAGSLSEIKELGGVEVTDLHRPAIDEVEFNCSCGGKMKRVKEVLDCWFESGSMPFAQFHFPFEQGGEADFQKPDFLFPADFIIEYTGQLRGWFYYLHVLSNALFDSNAFRNVIVSGVLAGTDGRKMSKSYGNYPDPKQTIEKYGADALRMYFMSSSIMSGGDTSLSERDIQDALRKNVMILWNVVKFYEMFTEGRTAKSEMTAPSENVLDKWVLARLNELIAEVTEGLEKYDLPAAAKPMQGFIDDLSTWYLRRSRDRFKGEDQKDKEAALDTMGYVLLQLSKVIAPIMPFMAEQVWQRVTGLNFGDASRSVHLEEWPVHESGIINHESEKILNEMEIVRKIVEMGLAKRDEAGIKVRQPLQKFSIFNFQFSNNSLICLIEDELNVKEVSSDPGSGDLKVELDTNITEELKLEGVKREIVRTVNAMRKDAGLSIQDRIVLHWESENAEAKSAMEKFKDELMKDVLANEVIEGSIEGLANSKALKIESSEIKLAF